MRSPEKPLEEKSKSVRAFITGLCLPVFALIPGMVQSVEPAGWYIFHSANAGTIDSTGWTDAHSEDGKFSIRMPGLYSDKTVWSRPTRETPATTGESIVARSPDGVSLLAARMQYNGPTVAREIFRKHQAEPLSMTHSSRRALRVSGFEAVDDTRLDAGIVVMERRILVGRELLLVVVAGPASARTEAIASTALGSLRIEDSGPLVIGAPPAGALPVPSEPK
jgi:hypothetical protein